MLVRLDPEEREPTDGSTPPKGFVDKDEEGFCVHFHRETGHCAHWQSRPRVCREYDCNADSLLQIVLREGFVSLTTLVRNPLRVRPDERIQIPAKKQT